MLGYQGSVRHYFCIVVTIPNFRTLFRLALLSGGLSHVGVLVARFKELF